MNLAPLRILAVTASLWVGATGAVLAQAGGSQPGDNDPHGWAPGRTQVSPSVDTGSVAPSKTPLHEAQDPQGTGSVIRNANPPGNPAGTIDAGPGPAISSGSSGRNPCYPGQSGQQVGSTNPSGMASQCR